MDKTIENMSVVVGLVLLFIGHSSYATESINYEDEYSFKEFISGVDGTKYQLNYGYTAKKGIRFSSEIIEQGKLIVESSLDDNNIYLSAESIADDESTINTDIGDKIDPDDEVDTSSLNPDEAENIGSYIDPDDIETEVYLTDEKIEHLGDFISPNNELTVEVEEDRVQK